MSDGVTKQIHLNEKQFCVTHASPRILVVVLKAGVLSYVFVVLHAPHTGKGHGNITEHDAVISNFWARVKSIVKPFRGNTNMIWLMDANAVVGSATSEAIGSHHRQTECTSGQLLHNLLLEHSMFLPGTFGELHDHSSPCTWGNNQIDHIAFSMSLRSKSITSGILPESDFISAKKDEPQWMLIGA